MDSVKGLIIFCAYFVILEATMNGSVEANSKHFKVGDHFGWQQPTTNDSTEVYSEWATSKRFHVGDSLCELISYTFFKNLSIKFSLFLFSFS